MATWNINHGGGRRAAGIVDAIRGWDADVVALSEVRAQSIAAILEPLRDVYPHQLTSDVGRQRNGMALLSRHRVEAPEVSSRAEPPWRWLEWYDTMLGTSVLTVHIPMSVGNGRQTQTFWSEVLRWCGRNGARAMVLGDLNTGLHHVDETGAFFSCHQEFRALSNDAMWRDAWRHINDDASEYTWFSAQGHGFRIDHAFVTADLVGRVSSCEYDHSVRRRRLSDHSALLTDLIT